MTELRDAADVQTFLDRFGGFYDAIIVEILLVLPRAAAQRRATIRLLAHETAVAGQEPAWRSVLLHLTGLTDFKLIEGQISNQVLSDGLKIHLLGDRCFIDMAPYSDQLDDEASLWHSGQYLVAATCKFEVADAQPEK